MQHTFLNYLFLHLPCIKVLCLSPTSVFFAGHLPPPECRRVPNSSLYLLLSVCLSLLCSPRPPHLSLSLNLSFSPDVSTSCIVLHIIHKPKTPLLFQHQPYITPKLPNCLPKSIHLHLHL